MSRWFSAPQPPPFYPHLGQPCPNPHLPGTFPSPSKCHQPASKAILTPKQPPALYQTPHPILAPQAQPLASTCQHHMPSSSQHVPRSLWSGCGHLGFSSFIPVMGDAAVEPRVEYPMRESNSGLLCPGRYWRVHETLPGSRSQGGLGRG